jgi:hypothetical protein
MGILSGVSKGVYALWFTKECMLSSVSKGVCALSGFQRVYALSGFQRNVCSQVSKGRGSLKFPKEHVCALSGLERYAPSQVSKGAYALWSPKEFALLGFQRSGLTVSGLLR